MKIIPICFTALFFLFVLKSSETFAQTTMQQGLSLRDLTLTVATTKQTFLLLEPIPFLMTLKNNTPQPITAKFDLSFTGRKVKIFVQGANGTESEIGQLAPYVGSGLRSGTHRMMPGDEMKESEMLALDIERFFSVPGNYRIMAQLCNDEECTDRSNSLSFMLTEPQGQDLQAYNFIKASASPKTFFLSSDQLTLMKQFAARFPTTPYNDYVLEMIGQNNFFFERYQQAIMAYEKISPQYAFAERIKKRITDAKKAIADAQK